MLRWLTAAGVLAEAAALAPPSKPNVREGLPFANPAALPAVVPVTYVCGVNLAGADSAPGVR